MAKKVKKKTPKKPTKEKPKCEVCGYLLNEIHCRLTCPRCGATRDCSDP